jgi:hypothetical protein
MYFNSAEKRVCRRTKLFGSILALVTVVGCTSKTKQESTTKVNTPQSTAANAPSDDHFDGGTYCAQTFLQGPPPAQLLHFSNKVTESDPSSKSKDFEADLSGDTADLIHHDKWLATDEDRKFFEESRKFEDPKVIVRTIKDGIAEETVTNHATRSDGVSWRGIVTGIAQGGTPWNLFVSKPPVKRVGTENVNGFDTVKYAVDTTQQSATDKSALKMFSRLQDYNITGTAWILPDSNCVLQYDIDYVETGQDGKVSKTHYDGTVTKK